MSSTDLSLVILNEVPVILSAAKNLGLTVIPSAAKNLGLTVILNEVKNLFNRVEIEKIDK